MTPNEYISTESKLRKYREIKDSISRKKEYISHLKKIFRGSGFYKAQYIGQENRLYDITIKIPNEIESIIEAQIMMALMNQVEALEKEISEL